LKNKKQMFGFGYKEKTGRELIEEAKRLGVSLEHTKNRDGSLREGALQARVREAKRARRESALWLIAFISAIASLFSAIAAWIAALR